MYCIDEIVLYRIVLYCIILQQLCFVSYYIVLYLSYFIVLYYITTELPVEIVTPLDSGETTETETFTFDCELSKPNKKVTWYKGEQSISLDDSHFTISNDGYKYSLTLHECTLDDGAEYTLRCDDVSTTATLTVKGKSTTATLTVKGKSTTATLTVKGKSTNATLTIKGKSTTATLTVKGKSIMSPLLSVVSY